MNDHFIARVSSLGWWRIVALAGVVTLAAALVVFPEIDQGISRLFYVPGQGFPARNGSDYHLAVRRAVRIVGWISGIALVAALVWRVALGRALFGVSRQAVIYLALAAALGPGVVTNAVLKEHWGRARPSQTAMFGKTKAYTPPLLIADQCAHNCSFVSGDASGGFIFVAFGFLAVRRIWRIAGFGLGLGLGTLFGYTRIAQGGHWFSDIVFAALFMVAVAWLLHVAVIRRDWLALPLMLLKDRGG